MVPRDAHGKSGKSRKRGKKGGGDKGGKGLRHFSMKVCEKVQKKGVTSYNEVADELVTEFSDPRTISPTDQVRINFRHIYFLQLSSGKSFQ